MALPAILAQLVGLIPTLIGLGTNVVGLWQWIDQQVSDNKTPGDEEWERLEKMIAAQKALFDNAASKD